MATHPTRVGSEEGDSSGGRSNAARSTSSSPARGEEPSTSAATESVLKGLADLSADLSRCMTRGFADLPRALHDVLFSSESPDIDKEASRKRKQTPRILADLPEDPDRSDSEESFAQSDCWGNSDQGADSDLEDRSDTEQEDASSARQREMVDGVIELIQEILQLSDDPPPAKKSSNRVSLEKQKKSRRFFPTHSNFEDLISRAWDHPSKVPKIPKWVEARYPFPEDWVNRWASPPAVDGPISCLSKSRIIPSADSASLADPVDRRLEALAKHVFAFTAAIFRPLLAESWATRAIISNEAEARRALLNGRPREEVALMLEKTSKLADFARGASLDAGRLAAVASASANTTRRIIWLKQWSGDAGSKRTLTELPLRGRKLFGSHLKSIIKDITGGKSTLLPHSKRGQPSKSYSDKSRPFRRYNKSGQSSFRRSSSHNYNKRQTQNKPKSGWQNKNKPAAKPAAQA